VRGLETLRRQGGRSQGASAEPSHLFRRRGENESPNPPHVEKGQPDERIEERSVSFFDSENLVIIFSTPGSQGPREQRGRG